MSSAAFISFFSGLKEADDDASSPARVLQGARMSPAEAADIKTDGRTDDQKNDGVLRDLRFCMCQHACLGWRHKTEMLFPLIICILQFSST